MKKLTPAAIKLLSALGKGGGHYPTHPSTREALLERGWATYGTLGAHRVLVITDAGREVLRPPRRNNPAPRPRGSANGYRLEVSTPAGNKYDVVASWAAPYFVLIESDGGKGQEDKPGLYHAETLADARRVARHGGKILNADFTDYKG